LEKTLKRKKNKYEILLHWINRYWYRDQW